MGGAWAPPGNPLLQMRLHSPVKSSTLPPWLFFGGTTREISLLWRHATHLEVPSSSSSFFFFFKHSKENHQEMQCDVVDHKENQQKIHNTSRNLNFIKGLRQHKRKTQLLVVLIDKLIKTKFSSLITTQAVYL